MTREEARAEIEEEFKIFLEGTSLDNTEILEEKMKENAELRKVVEANRMAIKALEQEPCEDCVRRKDVLDLVVANHRELNGLDVVMYSPLTKDIKQLQSVNSQTDILDKIRAEVKANRDDWMPWETEYHAYNRCLEIIDKYKAESEDKE